MLYVIADLHLSTAEGMNKSMEVFGRRWSGYVERLEKNWRAVIEPEDSVVIPGDISWALTLPESASDLRFLDSLPGHKYIGKGNHDFWWSTASKTDKFFEEQGITTVSLLNNNAWVVEDFIICGTRGWFQDESIEKIPKNTDYDKLVAREAIRLSLSLEEGKKLGVKNEERSKEELDMLKECIIGASFIHKYCRDKELPTAIIDMVICETAMRWYEKDYETKVTDPMDAPELPAYHVHVTKFIEEFSAHIKDVRNAVENGTFDEELNLKVEDNK